MCPHLGVPILVILGDSQPADDDDPRISESAKRLKYGNSGASTFCQFSLVVSRCLECRHLLGLHQADL